MQVPTTLALIPACLSAGDVPSPAVIISTAGMRRVNEKLLT